MKRLLISNGGTTGKMMADLMRKKLTQSEWAITVIEKTGNIFINRDFFSFLSDITAKRDIQTI
jgi:hypothetical protein